MIKCLFIDLGWAGQEKQWLSLMTHDLVALGPLIMISSQLFLARPFHSVNNQILLPMISSSTLLS